MDNTPDSKSLKKTKHLAIIWIIIALVVGTTATYAWITFEPVTNVTPMAGTVSDKGIALMIANSASGPFGETCDLAVSSAFRELRPVSTANINSFYMTTAQDRDGISILYKDATTGLDEYVAHGTVYLNSQNAGCDVYFNREGMGFNATNQVLGALRMAMRITTAGGTSNVVFNLDSFAGGGLQETRTVPTPGTVVESISTGGVATYVTDPAVAIDGYYAGGDTTKPLAGTQKLCSLVADEVGSVEYWIYLEGCDNNCINVVQGNDFVYKFSFAGVAVGD